MRLKLDTEGNKVYLRLDEEEEVVESREVDPGVGLDVDGQGRVVGIEVLRSARQPPIETLRPFIVEISERAALGRPVTHDAGRI